ncbi:hypothetical protein [Bradyrhizobium sp. RDI18]
MTTHDVALSRRAMLKGAAGLVIGLYLPEKARAIGRGARLPSRRRRR